MVLERPSPCEDLLDCVERCGDTLNEDVTRLVMWQAMFTAYMCCQRGVSVSPQHQAGQPLD